MAQWLGFGVGLLLQLVFLLFLKSILVYSFVLVCFYLRCPRPAPLYHDPQAGLLHKTLCLPSYSLQMNWTWVDFFNQVHIRSVGQSSGVQESLSATREVDQNSGKN